MATASGSAAPSNDTHSSSNSAAASSCVVRSDAMGDIAIQSFLEKSGIVAANIDPSSREALREIFAKSRQNPSILGLNPSTIKATSGFGISSAADAKTAGARNEGSRSSVPMIDANNSITIPPDATTTERLILEQLERQTALLLHLNRRLDQLELSQEQRLSSSPTHAASGQTTQTSPAQPVASHVGVTAIATRNRAATENPRQPPAPRGPSFYQRASDAWKESRMGKIVNLYFTLRRAHNNNVRNNAFPPLDPLMIIKVLVMLAILVSRIAPPRKHQQNTNQHRELKRLSWKIHFVFLSTLVILAFLYQSGILSFWYRFWIKDQYPYRIWKGEDISLEEALQHQASGGRPEEQRNNGNNGRNAGRGQDGNANIGPAERNEGGEEERNNHWLMALVFGAQPVPRNENAPAAQQPVPPQTPLPIKILQDFVILLGSFFLSIFPMWRAIGPAEPVRFRRVVAPLQVDPDALPVVQPPVDPAGFEESDEDEGEDDDDDESDNGN